ncbi:MAG: chemotaxis protein CheR [Candidatus Lambdaproteobacteria bacterium]|nr:chemotaxis protein CheR [Candidatus Lambdaproteobacteria bacterium]
MRDTDCVALLEWALPRLGMRWAGFRRVRRQVCKRIARRLRALGLPDGSAYRARLEGDPGEWQVLDALCRVTISRFYRDRALWERLAGDLVPALGDALRSRGEIELRAWSAGCASGEEPYTLAALWERALGPSAAGLALRVLATDADARLLERARRARYGAGSVRELPPAWRAAAFRREDSRYRLREAYARHVTFLRQDIREAMPEGPWHLIFCRNLVFTYFSDPLQRTLAERLAARLAPAGLLVLGGHERLPPGIAGLAPLAGRGPPVFRRDMEMEME